MIASRFRDRKGNRVPAARLPNAGYALATAMLRVLFGYRPARPTISPAATRRIKRMLPATARIAEFGSGMSTIWFATHFASVASVEHDSSWSTRVSRHLEALSITNVDYIRAVPQTYACALDKYPDAHFDLVLVDGLARDACMERAIAKVKPDGFIYLDNTDADLAEPQGEMRRAERRLNEFVERTGGTIEYFTDFAPTNFFAEQGALARAGMRTGRTGLVS